MTFQELLISWSKRKSEFTMDSNFGSLERGLFVLRLSDEEFGHSYLTVGEINQILTEVFRILSEPLSLTRAFARAGGLDKSKKQIIPKKENNQTFYAISNPGKEHLDRLKGSGLIKLLYLEPNSHSESSEELGTLIKQLKGKELKICDPYFGVNTFRILEEIIRGGHKVKFLTYKTNENLTTLKTESAYLKKHYPGKIEIRIYHKNELHDRYILSDDAILIVGQGIKDLGNKESLALLIKDKFGKEIRKTLQKTFFIRWDNVAVKKF